MGDMLERIAMPDSIGRIRRLASGKQRCESLPSDARPSRRDVVRLGALGVSLPVWLRVRAAAAADQATLRGTFGQARSCIVLFAWGGMSHLDTLDMKPSAGSEIRGIFSPISTTVPGIQISQHLPHLARQVHRMAIVRSAHHRAPSHRSAAYWNLTGHEPPNLAGNWPATRRDWPSLGSLVWDAAASHAGSLRLTDHMPGTVALPYPLFDGGRANGQDGGFLGLKRDPVIVRPKEGQAYDGKSADFGNIDLSFLDTVDRHRLVSRRSLLESLNTSRLTAAGISGADYYQHQALDMLLDPQVRHAFEVDREPDAIRQRYGMHICGQSVLMARKLTEAGVPLVTVYCAAGDLNGSIGAHWDTHGDNFNRLKRHMLPPLDQASAALLDDLDARGRLNETLVVWLTEFGRTPRINAGAGRDHYPNVYSVAFAGGGIRGGQVYGSSDPQGAEPQDNPCTPADLHATIFHALGIDRQFTVHDGDGRPLLACDGNILPLF
jgi:hypothetical protein